MTAQVIRHSPLSVQVCIPADWTDAQAVEFAQADTPCGTTLGWQVRKQGDHALRGDDERVCCQPRAGFVHLVLDA